MSTNNHRERTQFSISLTFCLAIVLLMVSVSTTTMVHALDQSSSGKDSSSKNGSASTPLNGVNSDTTGSGSSGTANSTGNSAGGSSGNTGGSSNGGGGTESDNRSRGPSSNQGSTHCDRSAHPSCSSLDTEARKTAPGIICSSGHSKVFCAAYDSAAGSYTNNKNNNHHNNASSSPQRPEAADCDQSGWPSCYRLGFQDGKNHAGSACPLGHSANFCSGWNVGASSYNPSSSCPVILINSHCPLTKITGGTGLGTILEIAPGAPAGPHTSEYIEAFNTASANPYKPGTKQYENYQKGLDDAKKAGRDCDKMDTCGGPDLLGNTVKGVLHLNDQQYCGNGFGVHSSKLCKFREGCTTNSLGTVTCPQPQSPLPRNCHYILGRLICRPATSM